MALDAVSHDVEFTINESNINHDNLTSRTHDGDTLQLDAINSDGGAFNFDTSGALNLRPSGDLDDYVQFTTTTGYPVLKRIGGASMYFQSDWSAEASIIIEKSFQLYLSAYTTYNRIYSTAPLTIQGNSVSTIKLLPNGDNDNYIEFSTTTNVPKMDFVGGTNGLITNLADPSSAQDAATKNYVDTVNGTAIHDNVAGEINAIAVKGSPTGADILVIEDSADSWNKKKVTLSSIGAGGGGAGETNTASSAGAGTSIFYQKDGVDLQFNGLKSENALLSVALDAVSHDVEFTVEESNFTLDGVTAQIDGINSDGGNFTFALTGNLLLQPSGDTDDYFSIRTQTILSSDVPTIGIIGSSYVGFDSNSLTNVKAVFWEDDSNYLVIGYDKTNNQGEIGAPVGIPICIQPGGDSSNYIEFSTTSNVPKIEFAGGINGLITNLADPTNAQDAATKVYVDNAITMTAELSTNQTYDGFTLSIGTTGLSFGECAYISANNTASLALSGSGVTMPSIGVFVASGKILTHGTLRDDAWSWTAGNRLYVGTGGDLTAIAPSAAGDFVQIMGVAVSTSGVMIMPSLTEVKHA